MALSYQEPNSDSLLSRPRDHPRRPIAYQTAIFDQENFQSPEKTKLPSRHHDRDLENSKASDGYVQINKKITRMRNITIPTENLRSRHDCQIGVMAAKSKPGFPSQHTGRPPKACFPLPISDQENLRSSQKTKLPNRHHGRDPESNKASDGYEKHHLGS